MNRITNIKWEYLKPFNCMQTNELQVYKYSNLTLVILFIEYSYLKRITSIQLCVQTDWY